MQFLNMSFAGALMPKTKKNGWRVQFHHFHHHCGLTYVEFVVFFNTKMIAMTWQKGDGPDVKKDIENQPSYCLKPLLNDGVN